MLFHSIWVNDLTRAISLTVLPLTLIPSSIQPVIHSESFLLVLIVGPHIPPTVTPPINSLPMHHIIFPLPLVASPVNLLVKTPSLYFSLLPVSLIGRSISPLEHSLPMLKPILELSLVDTAVNGGLLPIA